MKMQILHEGNIGSLFLKNRIIMAPMNVGGLNQTDGKLSERAIDYFVERARGGVGMIIVGFTKTTRSFELPPDNPYLRNTFADDKVHVSWMSELAELCHDYGTKVAIQLSPGVGRQAGGFMQSKGLAVGPSEINCFWPPHSQTRPLTKIEIKQIVDSFQIAAYHCKMAGIDAIHLHGHEGYLLDQFKTALWNKRTDEYGGSLQNRLRFSIEIIDALKKGAGNDFPIIYRYGVSHEFEGGRTLEEGLEIAKMLEASGVSALDVDTGSYENWYLAHPPSTLPAGLKLNLIERVKNSVNIPVVASGKIGYPEIAEEAINIGKADFICLGRPLLADPYWVKKLEENRPDDIRPCIGCHEGCLKRIYEHKYISCAVNPATGIENKLKILPSKKAQRILIVGGGVSGMEAARVLKKRGHEVRIIEKNNQLGGNFRKEYLPGFKYDYLRYVNYMVSQLKKLTVEVILNHQFTSKDIETFKPDVLFLANGAKYIEPNIPGIDKIEKISVVGSFGKKRYSGRIAVVGGGLVGTEAAINLAQNGASVTLIEKKSEIATDAFLPNKQHLELLLEKNFVKLLTNVEVEAFSEGKISCKELSGKHFEVITDKVVICMGMQSDQEALRIARKHKNIKTVQIGDSIKPGKVINAVWDAYRMALHI
jgi:2-enoate reductase